MTNYEWLKSLSIEDMAEMIGDVTCEMCFYNRHNQKCTQDCVEGVAKWLKDKHIEPKPMPKIKIGDVIYSYIGESRAKFVVMSDIYASNLHGIIVRWRELDTIWKIERMNDEKEMLEVIWRADDEEK